MIDLDYLYSEIRFKTQLLEVEFVLGKALSEQMCPWVDHHHHHHHHHLLYAGYSHLYTETNQVFRVYSVTAILRVLLMVHITLSSILNSFVLLH
jgi:UDP-N-acetylmuramyl pentapeptide phosphotransferase/UDP-N-acetylglucosamine-1-phosphate transferase